MYPSPVANCTGKYEAVRGQLKCKDAATWKADAQRDLRDESLVSFLDEKRAHASALQKTLVEISRCISQTSSALCGCLFIG